MRKPWRTFATSLFLLAILGGTVFGHKILARGSDGAETLRVYTELISTAHERYGSAVPYRELVFASIQGMLRTLDPHTSFMSPKAYTGLRERQQSTFFGLGILVSMRNGQLTVITPIEGTPASRLGIRAGDVISQIEGEPTDTMTVDEAVDHLKGPKDTQVHIEIVRRGMSEPLKLTVTRAEIPQTTVRYAYMLDQDTGYIWLTDFNRASADEVARAIAQLKAQGMKRLLFDLRNNGGGLLDQAIDIADQFVPRNGMIVETRGRTADSMQELKASGRYPALDEPIIVLVNRGTASAAEIVSGAIQDHDMGLIVGTPTWGKGLVQTVFTLPYGAGMALTTAKYYTPSGRLIQRDYTSYYDYVTVADQPGETGAPTAATPPGEVFHTDLGRNVFGGGGITPDVAVENDELSTFDQLLLARNAFLNFAVDYLTDHKVESQAWRPDAAVIDDLKRWLVREKIATQAEVDNGFAKDTDTTFALRMVAGEVLNARFGQVAQHRALVEGDKQIQRARELFDRAQGLQAQREIKAIGEQKSSGGKR